jgi:hypothetical protein
MLILDALAEQRIREAIERGELDDLPGRGRPLDLSEDPLVPEDLRLAYRALKNGGFVPAELETRREIATLEQLIDSVSGDDARAAALRKLELLRLRLAQHGRGARLAGDRMYFRKILKRLG